MSEKPILFSTPMVEAILDGRKTMTRRIFQKVINKYTGYRNQCAIQSAENPEAGIVPLSEKEFFEVHSPYFKGDILWVRENFQLYPIQEFLSKGGEMKSYEKIPKQKPESYYVEYAAGQETKRKWRPSIFMPRWASRIFLEVKNVRIEKVQDISEQDARYEGVKLIEGIIGFLIKTNLVFYGTT